MLHFYMVPKHVNDYNNSKLLCQFRNEKKCYNLYLNIKSINK